MLLEMRVPSPGESISEVEIAEWLVEDGDYVEKDQSIAEIDSDKATLELPAEESGTIKIVVGDGEIVAVGDVVCIIDTSAKGESKIKDTKEEVTKTPKSTLNSETILGVEKATPLASAMISEHDILVKDLKGTGEAGKITKSDVLGVIQGHSTDGPRGTSRKKMSSLRRKLARGLVSVKNETAMLTTFNEADLSNIFNLRKKYKEAFSQKHGVSLGFMSFFTKAVTRALELYPDVNSMIDGNEKISYNYSDISIAVSGPKGLMTPVLRNAQDLSFAAVEQEIKRLADNVRDKSITVDDLTGGTFTISNGGVFGSMLSTPIINPPQSGILGMHNIIQRPIAVEGKVEIRPMMYLALSYDHRIIDGNQSVGFLIAVKEGVEDPENILMDGKIEKSLGLN